MIVILKIQRTSSSLLVVCSGNVSRFQEFSEAQVSVHCLGILFCIFLYFNYSCEYFVVLLCFYEHVFLWYFSGTRGPIWVKGSYPKQDGETRTLLACARILTKCCARSWNVEVKKCFEKNESFFVYNLKEAPGCPMAYCAG